MLLERENKKLVSAISELTRKLLTLEGKDQVQLALRLAELEHQLSVQNKKLFGQTTERTKEPQDTQAPQSADVQEKKPQTGHGPREQAQLPIFEELHELDEADRICTACGDALGEWEGQFEESEEIDVIERQFVLKKHKRKKYVCVRRTAWVTSL